MDLWHPKNARDAGPHPPCARRRRRRERLPPFAGPNALFGLSKLSVWWLSEVRESEQRLGNDCQIPAGRKQTPAQVNGDGNDRAAEA
jgi:hypothetical protein